jgi:hypothetical protein
VLKKWRRLGCTLLSERSQCGKASDCMILNIEHCRESKTINVFDKS